MKKSEVCIITAVLVVIALLACGCQEQQTVWGKGQPPEEWLGFFDNSNLSRFNYFQAQIMDRQGQVILQLAEKVERLEGVADPNKFNDFVELNAKQHEKMGKTDIRFHKRILILEEVDSNEPNLPYIYYSPLKKDIIRYELNTLLDTVCTKHGRLVWGERWVFSDTMNVYCQRCVYDVLQIYLDRHIGTDPNQ